jgi:hypothetical protein
MKKQQKIIELRTAAKLKVAEIKTKIAFVRSDYEAERAGLLWRRAKALEGLEAESAERYDVLNLYRAKLADVNKNYESTVAKHKAEIMKIKSECERECAAAEDDPESETDTDVTVKGFRPQETVYCDGSEHSARIVARRLINKMPHVQKGGSLSVNIIHDNDGIFFVGVFEQGEKKEDYISTTFAKSYHDAEFEADFMEKARKLFEKEPESGNSNVAEPISRALDAFFGGNPVEQVDNLISDTIKDGKEGGNE